MLRKIAFIGSVGSGKTTLIRQLSHGETLDTDVDSTIDIGKQKTTVGIDYGHVVLDDDTILGLYGVPGQRKFSLVWDHVKEGLWSVVILLKNNDTESIDELNYLIDYFEITNKMPVVVAVTHVGQSGAEKTIAVIQKKLNELQITAPIFSIDPRDFDSAMLIMKTLIAIEENE